MTSVKQMRDYLRLATIMESDLYSSKQLVNKLSGRIKALSSTAYYTEQNYIQDSIKNMSYQKKKKHLPLGVRVFIVLCVLSCMIALAVVASTTSHKETMQNVMLYGVSFGMWAVIIGVVLFIRRKSAKEKVDENQLINQVKLKNSNELKMRNDLIIADYNVQLNEARKQVNTAQQNLNRLYSENILPAQYRNMIAVATMYQWLCSGRCTEIYGHGGLFDTYEYDKKMGMIISTLGEINDKLDTVISNQNELYNEVVRGNEIAEKTYQSVRNIENNTDRMARDVSQIKVNSNITAMNTARSARMNEYMYYRSLYY